MHKSGISGVYPPDAAPASTAVPECRIQMATKSLSGREAEIVELATQGLTNEAIGIRLGVSIGTINTYWSRIKSKTGGASRTDTVARIVGDRAEQVLQRAESEHAGIEHVIQAGMAVLIREKESDLFNLHAAAGMLQLTTEKSQAMLWAVDRGLRIQMVVNPQRSSFLPLAIGKTLDELLGTSDPSHPALASHFSALQGKESVVVLGSGSNVRFLRTTPIWEDGGDVIGCIGMMTSVDP